MNNDCCDVMDESSSSESTVHSGPGQQLPRHLTSRHKLRQCVLLSDAGHHMGVTQCPAPSLSQVLSITKLWQMSCVVW